MGEFGPAIVKKDLYRHFRYFFNIFIIKIACRIGKNYFFKHEFWIKINLFGHTQKYYRKWHF